MADAAQQETRRLSRGRVSVSKGLATIGSATILLFVVSAVIEPASVSPTSLSGMLPVAAVLAIAGLGQMLVVQQGGIDLSVAGGISLVAGDRDAHPGRRRLASWCRPSCSPCVFAIGAGVLNGG